MNQNNKSFLLKLRQPQNLLILHFSLSAVWGIVFLISLLISISRGDNSFERGISTGRMFFLATIVLAVLALLLSAFYLFMRLDRARTIGDFIFKNEKNRNIFLRMSGIGFVFCWMGYFYPSYLILQEASGYLPWIKPLLLWGMFYFASMVGMFRLEAHQQKTTSPIVLNKKTFQFILVTLLVLCFIAVFMINTGIGISTQEDYWYGAGVPVLWIQILSAVFIAIVFSWLISHVRSFKGIARIDVFVFIFLWALTAFAWAREPLQPSHFMPDTGINAIYPYSDSATFDTASQYALIGQGLFNGNYFDRTLYSALLTYLHMFAGQNTENLMVFQSVVYAFFPAILYLLGRELHGRILGISLGFLIMFRGINSIFGASLIDLAGPKMMLTDFPTAIGVALIMLFTIKWLKTPAKVSNMIWAGCFIGLTLLLRTHVILLLPFLIAYMALYFKNNRKFLVYGSIFLILGMIISTLPLDFQNQKKGVPMFYMYYSRIQDVLKARYKNSDEPKTNIPATINESAALRHERLIIYENDRKLNCPSRLCAIGNHFFHNLAGSVLYLPASFVFDDFRHTVKETAPYWGKDWTGEGVTPGNYLLLFANLAIISIGLGSIWAKYRLLGLFPLVIYFVYILSNSLAFTSGGRYLAPADWIIGIYYMLGLLEISFWSLRQTGFDFKLNDQDLEKRESSEVAPAISFRKSITTFVAVFMIGSLVPFTDSLFPRRYSQENVKDVLLVLSEHGLLEDANLTQAAVADFLTTPNARLISGRLLYPRFYPSDKGELGLDYPYTALGYRRLVFLVVGPFSAAPNGVILPIEGLQPDLHASDVIVLGCAHDDFLDAAAVFVLSQPDKVYIRSTTDLILQCPLANP